MAMVIKLSVRALPLNVILASTGSTTGKLMANVPTIAVSSRVDRSSGVCHTYRSPARIWPFARSTGALR